MMDITATSMVMSSLQVKQDVSLAVLGKSMDLPAESMSALLAALPESMPMASHSNLGALIDITI